MKPFQTMRFAALAVVATAALMGVPCSPAQAALFQCTSTTGETLFTDAGCPAGYKTDLMVPESPAPAKPSAEPEAVSAPARGEAKKPQAAEAEAARVEAELENARLRSELQQERLRTIDRKLDALLEAQPVYGAVGVVPFGAVPKPFSVCKGKPGQTPWVNCRPGRADLKPKTFVEQRPSCGIAGCTPSIIRRPDRDDAGRTVR
jgi:hypothetical protein